MTDDTSDDSADADLDDDPLGDLVAGEGASEESPDSDSTSEVDDSDGRDQNDIDSAAAVDSTEASGADGATDRAQPPVDNPFGGGDGSDGSDADGDAERTNPDQSTPFDDLAREVKARRQRRDADPDDDLFEHVDVDDVDDDDLWEVFDETDGPALGSATVEEVAGAAAEHDARPEHVVNKREYCQQCPFFSAPPAVECGHDGTNIVAVVDAERFRVRGCPMVTETGRPNFGAVTDDADEEADSADAGEETTHADAADAGEADT